MGPTLDHLPHFPCRPYAQADNKVTIESFDSDIEIQTEVLAASIQVRFFIRGLSGSLRLRFPKIKFRSNPKTVEEQARIFYRLVDVTESAILDTDYYTHLSRSLEDLEINLGLFPEVVDITPFIEVLVGEEARTKFFENLNVAGRWQEWLLQLRAVDKLLDAEAVRQHVGNLSISLIARNPQQAIHLLGVCQKDPKLSRLGEVFSNNMANGLQSIAADARTQAEEAILAWAVQCDVESWDIDLETGDIDFLSLRRRLDDFSLDVIPHVLWKLIGAIHARICDCDNDAGPLLDKFAWCVQQAEKLSPNWPRIPAALKLIAAGEIPRTVRDGGMILEKAVDDLPALDVATLNQYGVPQKIASFHLRY